MSGSDLARDTLPRARARRAQAQALDPQQVERLCPVPPVPAAAPFDKAALPESELFCPGCGQEHK